MPATGSPRHTPEEIARAGSDIFERRVHPVLGPADDGKFVAIDVETGDHAIDADDYVAVKQLRIRRPLAEIWLVRVGQPAAYRMRRGG
jgi:hypothetical protein